MSRLYAVECMPSTSGSVADHRLPLPSSQIESFARALAAKLGVGGAPAAGKLSELAESWLDPLAKDLQAHKGRCVVIPGDAQPPAVHALAHAINGQLGNLGQTVHATAPVEARPDGKLVDFPTLVKEMGEKKVDVLLLLGGTNPAYTAPADLDFAGAIKNVPFTAHLGSHRDETAALCEWHVKRGPLPRNLGRHPGVRRDRDGPAAAHRPAVRRPVAARTPRRRDPVRQGRRVRHRQGFLAGPVRAGCREEGREEGRRIAARVVGRRVRGVLAGRSSAAGWSPIPP